MIALAVAFVTSTAGMAGVVPLLRRRQILDIPNGRSSHALPVPRGGGIAVAFAIALAVVAEAASGTDVPWLVLCIVLGMAAVGLVDDLRTLSSRSRLLAQLLAGAALAWWLAVMTTSAGWPVVPFLLIVTVGFAAYVNAFNFMDGINAISGISAAVAGFWFAAVGVTHDFAGLVTLGLAVAGASAGFVPWNAPRARVFLGDVGSYALGGAIVSMAMIAWASGVGVLASSAPLLVYLADTLWALLKRAAHRQPIGQPHREHVYQRLVDAGASHVAIAAVVGLLTAFVCLVVYWAPGGSVPTIALTGAAVLTYLALPSLVAREHRMQGSVQ